MQFEHFPFCIGYMEVPGSGEHESAEHEGEKEGQSRAEYVSVQLAVLRVLLTHTLAYMYANIRSKGRQAPEVSCCVVQLLHVYNLGHDTYMYRVRGAADTLGY